MPRVPEYRVVIRDTDPTDYGPADVVVELDLHKNLGWSVLTNDVGEAFFTMTQGDPKLPLVADLVDAGAHVQILRGDQLVWAGLLGETDETETDVIVYAYSYECNLFWLHSGWDSSHVGKTIGQIVTDTWNGLQAREDSGTAWMTDGTIEAPVTTSGGSTAIILPEYTSSYKRGLFIFQEMAGLAASDTTNRVAFEITPEGVFNFYKNRGTTLTSERWDYGGGAIIGYRRIRKPMDSRNVLLGAGSSPRDILLRDTEEDAAHRIAHSRKEEGLFFSWVRSAEELDRVMKFRLKRATRIDNQLSLTFASGRVTPFRAIGADFSLLDQIHVKIQHGATNIDGLKLITGQQVILVRGKEHVRVLLQDTL